jgi:hypothetical protein
VKLLLSVPVVVDAAEAYRALTCPMKAASGAVNTEGKNIMKLITAQELQSMNDSELRHFFNNLSRNQAEREAEEIRWSRSVGNVALNLDLYSEYSFD